MSDILSEIDVNTISSFDHTFTFLKRYKRRIALSDRYIQDICTRTDKLCKVKSEPD